MHRAFYGVPDLTNAKGVHTNAIYGFLNILFSILEQEKAEYLAVAFDVHQPTFRHEMFKEYKGTRKPMLPELREQVPIIKGDAKSISIGAASIMAKVYRDRMMIEYDKMYPGYGFASNKGYGSKEHMEALQKIGPSPIHRQSFIKGICS